MPFASKRQRAYLYSQKPDVARKFSAHYGKPKRKKLRRTKSSPRY